VLLKKQIKQLKEEELVRFRKYSDEIEALRRQIESSYNDNKISKNSPKSRTKISPTVRDLSPRKSRSSSAPTSRFDPTAYIQQQQQQMKRTHKVSTARKSSPILTGRAPSVERKRPSPRTSPRGERRVSNNYDFTTNHRRSSPSRKSPEKYFTDSSQSDMNRYHRNRFYNHGKSSSRRLHDDGSDDERIKRKIGRKQVHYDSSDADSPVRKKQTRKKYYESSGSDSDNSFQYQQNRR
jgi:hypothetical protein